MPALSVALFRVDPVDHTVEVEGSAPLGRGRVSDGYKVMPFAIRDLRNITGTFTYSAGVSDGVVGGGVATAGDAIARRLSPLAIKACHCLSRYRL